MIRHYDFPDLPAELQEAGHQLDAACQAIADGLTDAVAVQVDIQIIGPGGPDDSEYVRKIYVKGALRH